MSSNTTLAELRAINIAKQRAEQAEIEDKDANSDQKEVDTNSTQSHKSTAPQIHTTTNAQPHKTTKPRGNKSTNTPTHEPTITPTNEQVETPTHPQLHAPTHTTTNERTPTHPRWKDFAAPPGDRVYVNIRLTNELNDWVEQYLFEHRKEGISKQDLLAWAVGELRELVEGNGE